MFKFFKRKFIWQKVRVGLMQMAQRLLVGQVAGNLPSHWIKSIPAAYFRAEIKGHLLQVQQLQVPTIAEYPFQKGLSLQFRRSKAFDSVSIYHFQDIWVSPSSALAFVPDELVLEESAGSLEKVSGWGKILPELLINRTELAEAGPMLVVPAAPFYHFIWEHLPMIIQALARTPEAKLLLPEAPPRYVKDSLALLLGPNWVDRAVFSNNLCKVKHLIVPQIERDSGFIHPANPAILQDAFAHVVSQEPYSQDKIYVSRRYAPSRLMRHEQELESALETLGFKILYLENLKLEDQMKVFRRAALIVAPHGAGLSHIHFCQPGTHLLEVFPDSYFNDCYARLAISLGFTYDYTTCAFDPKWHGGMLPVDNILVRIKTYLKQTEAAK